MKPLRDLPMTLPGPAAAGAFLLLFAVLVGFIGDSRAGDVPSVVFRDYSKLDVVGGRKDAYPYEGALDPSVSCADFNGDDTLNVGDPVLLSRYLFLGGPPPACTDATASCGDLNADGEINIEDVLDLLDWLFIGSAEITCAVSCENADAPDTEGFTFLDCNVQGFPEYSHDQTGIIFVRLPGGTFNMGSPEGQAERDIDEGPVHDVTLSPFLIAKLEVTQAQWHVVMGNYPSSFDGTLDFDGNPVAPPADRDRLPVEQVSWDVIQEFEERTGLTLPTEAQWEYACRGGTETAFSFGSGESCADWDYAPCPERDAYMWYGRNSGRRTQEVGSKPANPFGLHDMHGSVFEWCEDAYDPSFYSTAEAAGPDPLCTSNVVVRVARGGDWGYGAWHCRSAERITRQPGYNGSSAGFRPAAPSP